MAREWQVVGGTPRRKHKSLAGPQHAHALQRKFLIISLLEAPAAPPCPPQGVSLSV